MPRSTKPRLLLFAALFLALVLGGGIVATLGGLRGLAPVRLVAHYPWGQLVDEADVIEGCLECHETPDLHTCETCHNEHGDAVLSEVPFSSLLLLTGDVPQPDHIAINEIIPYHQDPPGHVRLLDFLEEYGVTALERVVLFTSDGGMASLEPQNLTAEALLLPYTDGLRFAAENLHVSTWMKGISRVVVVGQARPLRIDGERTSMGRLLLGPTRSVTVEETTVMLRSETDGEVREGMTAFRLEGAPLTEIVAHPQFRSIVVQDAAGAEHRLSVEEAQGGILAFFEGEVTLILPDRGRSQWIDGVVEIHSER